jgi:hypothetical protein
MEHAHLELHENTKPINHECRRKEELQTEGIDILFNRIIIENFPNLKKERVTQVQKA